MNCSQGRDRYFTHMPEWEERRSEQDSQQCVKNFHNISLQSNKQQYCVFASNRIGNQYSLCNITTLTMRRHHTYKQTRETCCHIMLLSLLSLTLKDTQHSVYLRTFRGVRTVIPCQVLMLFLFSDLSWRDFSFSTPRQHTEMRDSGVQ